MSGDANGTGRRLDEARLGDHLDRLVRAAWGLCGNREDAEDLVQETYMRVLGKPRLLRNDDDIGYLLRVLRNTHVSRLRAAGRRVRPSAFGDDAEPVDERLAWRPETSIETTALFAAISALPEDFRDALIAVDIVGLTYAEAGRVLRTRESTITTRLHRARLRVAAELRDADRAPVAGKDGAPAGVLHSA